MFVCVNLVACRPLSQYNVLTSQARFFASFRMGMQMNVPSLASGAHQWPINFCIAGIAVTAKEDRQGSGQSLCCLAHELNRAKLLDPKLLL